MEPPTKRLRIFQPADVDETHPDYLAAREQQKQKLKSKFESIFSKFEAIPEAMSDEIDMRTGTIVVDRGHYRRLDREYRHRRGHRPGQLLDDLIADEYKDDTYDEESADVDPRDELAPSQSPGPNSRTQHEPLRKQPSTKSPHNHSARLPGQHAAKFNTSPPYTPSATAIPNAQLSVAGASIPATNLMQLVQFPHTPAGQLAQTDFMAQITQAVQLAITPIISNLLSSGPGVQPQNANALQASVTPFAVGSDSISNTGLIRQSIVPPRQSNLSIATQSSPIPATAIRPRPSRPLARSAQTKTHQRKRNLKHPLPPHQTDFGEFPDTEMNDSTPSTEGPLNTQYQPAQERTWLRAHKYSFTSEEDRDILEKKTVLRYSWADIKSSRQKWHDWPLYAFHNHWNIYLKHKKLVTGGSSDGFNSEVDLQIAGEVEQQEQVRLERTGSKKEPPKFTTTEMFETSSPTASRHLPTPSSLGQHWKDSSDDIQNCAQEESDGIVASGAHFDEDERDLLSLAGASDTEDSSAEADEIVFHSIEIDMSMEDGAPNSVDGPGAPPKSSPILTNLRSPKPPSSKKAKAFKFQVDSDSEDDLDLVEAGSTPTGDRYSCDTSKKSFKTKKSHAMDMPQPPASTEIDELLAPATPFVKRESCTPPPNLLLASPVFRTPRSAPQLTTLHSSASESLAPTLARSAFLKKVKQSWATGGRKSTFKPRPVVKTTGFASVGKKRAWPEEGNSGDELAG